MTLELKLREGDTCPACGSGLVFAGVETKGHAGSVFIDGCADCLKLWERETRANPSSEPCSNCAWLPGSREIRSGEIYTLIQRTIHGAGIFYCHRRVPFSRAIADMKPGEPGGCATGFDHKMNEAGTRVTNAAVCAGWLKAKLAEKRFERSLEQEET